MVKLQEHIFEEDKTVLEAYDEVERQGNPDIKFMMIRQSKESDKARGNWGNSCVSNLPQEI